jgi:CheY-like chemotaxis protein
VSRKPTLLLVDDEPRILSALRRSLRREGYEILTAESGAEALALLAGHAVDLIVSDHKMPGHNGLEFLDEVARRHPEVPRIVLTGWPEDIPAHELARLGIGALLPKPWDDAVLKAEIRARAKPGGTG